MKRMLVKFSFVCSLLLSCQHEKKDLFRGNSIPLTPKENALYKRAMMRCHKDGGTRVVKIDGKLRCF